MKRSVAALWRTLWTCAACGWRFIEESALGTDDRCPRCGSLDIDWKATGGRVAR